MSSAKKGELKRQVEECLQKFPETRNSDITLTIKIWETYFADKIHYGQETAPMVRLTDLFILPREDNVKRMRAKFTEIGKYLPTTWEIAQKRQIEESTWRQYIRTFGIEDMAKPMPAVPTHCEHNLPLYVCCPKCEELKTK